jgi:hypothetical protein
VVADVGFVNEMLDLCFRHSGARPASPTAVNGTSPIKPKRRRRTKVEMAELRDALYAIAEAEQPTTDRHLFYVAVVQGLIAKTEQEYKNAVCRPVLEMRRNGRLPHRWIADHTRWMRKPSSYDSAGAMLAITAATYRRALWANQDAYVEVWCEKDTVAGILYEVTSTYDVPLMVARGFSSESFLYESAEALKAESKPCYIYYFGDLDPSGLLIAKQVDAGLRRLAPGVCLHFERMAVTAEQMRQFRLPTRPTKESSHSRGFVGESVELDALSTPTLRDLVRVCIEQHLDWRALRQLERTEAAERESLADLAAQYREVG